MTALPAGPLHPLKRALGVVLPGCFCLLALACFSGELRQVRWVNLMILFSAGVLMPLAQVLLPRAFRMPLQGVHRLLVLLLVAFSLLFELRSLNAALTVIPWFLLTGWTAARSFWSWKNQPDFSPASLCLLAAAAFPFVGASWLLAGVPLVAAGITCTRFGLMPWVEPLSVTILVMGALGVAIAQIRQGMISRQTAGCRFLWALSGTSLLVAMLLA